jgi:membrane protein implicated in regulation of membrane protease activity
MNISQQTFGFILIALGVIVAITGIISFLKGGRIKPVTFVIFVIASIGLGIQFSSTAQKKPMEIKEITFPQNPGRK